MITAIGGIASATADITTDAVTEYNRTTAHASTNRARHSPISRKYRRFRTARTYPGLDTTRRFSPAGVAEGKSSLAAAQPR